MQDNSGNWTWAVQDAQGSVRAEADDTLAILGVQHPDAYGNLFGQQGSIGLPFVYTGEMRDPIGLQYHRARYLNPAIGGWLSLDPFEGTAQRPMSLNGYMYVEGDPVNMVDPSGRCLSMPILQSDMPNTGQSSCPPNTGGTSCQYFISEIRCIIEMTKSQLREYCNTNWLECILRPPDEKAVVLDILAGYYAGLEVHNVLNWLPQLPTFRGVERYSTINDVAVDEWDSPILQDTATARQLQADYGFRRPYYANTHHYFAYLKFAYYYGELTWLPHMSIELLTLQGAIDDIEQRRNSGLSIVDQLTRYRWLYQESVNDLYIVSRGYDVAKLVSYFGIDLLPDALESEWCISDESGGSDVNALQSETTQFYRDFPEWYWPENVEERYR